MTKEEAINEIKSWDFLEGKEIEAIQTLIPELRESEDERTRKEIIEFIQWCEDRGMTRHDFHQAKRPSEWIAYLEKQKEITPCSVDEFTLTLRNCLFTDSELTKEQADIFATVYGEGLLNVATGKVKSGITKEDIADFKTEKQKEQPITANDLDEEIHRFFDDCIDVHEAKLYGSISERVIPVDCYEITARHFAKWGEKQKEQKPIAESKRLANEVIEYLTKCGYSPVLKDDSKKEHFRIDIPRHKDDFWLSEEYKHCRSVLGEYYMEGNYGGDTYTLYIWREKEEQKPSEQNIREQIVSKATTERQVVLISESNDHAEINWDTRSLEDTKALLECGLTFINKQLGIKSSGLIPKPKECKPVEWSEKDKEMLIKVGQIVLKHWNSLSDSFYHKHDDENEDAESCHNWIKYLPDRFTLESKRERGEEACLNETKQECSSIDISGSIKNSHIKTLENLLSYLKYERKTTQTEINISFIPCLENLLKDAENTNGHVECIKFDNEFENQVSYLLASILNGEHEYSSGFIKYAAQLLLGQAKNELKLTKWNDVTINGEPIPTEEQSVDISLANWSEDIIRKAVKEVGLTQRQIDWFKTNVFPPKQEWSEEDEHVLDNLIELAKIANPRSTIFEKISKEQFIEKLKSLRPSWKPSEEQMVALKHWLKDKQFDGASRYVYHIFESLYEQLKKLM